jgi:hypothetical protein
LEQNESFDDDVTDYLVVQVEKSSRITEGSENLVNLMIARTQKEVECGDFDRERREFLGKLSLERGEEQDWEGYPFWTKKRETK